MYNCLKTSVLERHFVSSELSCGIGILHKVVDFSVVVGCDVRGLYGKSVFLRVKNWESGKSLCKVHKRV